MSNLVVFYSRSGLTKQLGIEIARKLSADFEEIIDKKNRKNFLGFLISGYEAITQKLANIKIPEKDPQNYDLIVICSPVWAGSLSSPVRAYLELYKEKIKKVAFVATCISKPGKIFKQMKQITKEPVSTIYFIDKDILNNSFVNDLDLFIKALI